MSIWSALNFRQWLICSEYHCNMMIETSDFIYSTSPCQHERKLCPLNGWWIIFLWMYFDISFWFLYWNPKMAFSKNICQLSFQNCLSIIKLNVYFNNNTIFVFRNIFHCARWNVNKPLIILQINIYCNHDLYVQFHFKKC